MGAFTQDLSLILIKRLPGLEHDEMTFVRETMCMVLMGLLP